MKNFFEKNSFKKKKLSFNKFFAFTVAELAITLGVVGVIAAITMPLAQRYFHGFEFETASQKLQLLITDTLDKMNANQSLTNHLSTRDFVNNFVKFVDVSKICTSSDLTGCFPESFTAGEKEFSLSDVDGADFMGKNSWKTDVEGIVLKNGTSLLIAYNPNCSKKNPMNCASILYDLNSIKKDNIFKGNGVSDLGTYNAAFVGSSGINVVCTVTVNDTCFYTMDGGSFPPVNCSDDAFSSRDYKKYCGDYPSGLTEDYWAGAKKACDDAGLKLHDIETLRNLLGDLYNADLYHDIKYSDIYTASLYSRLDPSDEVYKTIFGRIFIDYWGTGSGAYEEHSSSKGYSGLGLICAN